MSAKDYFGKATTIQALANKSAEEIAGEVESVGYQEQDIVREERFRPRVDFGLPGNFARYGSAEEYYSQALNRICNYYPYDGSLKERVKWENESTYLDLYVFDQKYPRTNGYVKFSVNGWGGLSGQVTEGYGLPADTEYIYFEGGPHPNAQGMSPYKTQFSGSNYYEPALNRESNLKFDLEKKGATIEFWLKKEAFGTTLTEKEVIFDLWNGSSPGEASYGRLRLELTGNASEAAPFRLTVMSGTTGFETVPIGSSAITTQTVADDNWHHYALSLKSSPGNVDTTFYVDGELNTSASVSVGGSTLMKNVTGSLRATLGALIAAPTTGSAVAAYAGKLSGSLDEFRYWKTERTGKDVGRFWFTQVGGGTNEDPKPFHETTEAVNTHLGVYYKFNEGITGNTNTDAVVLDYSGRISNGSWTGYVSNSRSTGSAIVESLSAIKEFKDPIIRSSHPAVQALATSLQFTGSAYDVNNNSSIYNSIPSWITEEDHEGQRDLRNLTQILSSYFDTLHLQIEELSGLKNIEYPIESRDHKPLPFADRLLNSMGLVASDLFVDADVLEKLADRSEDRVFEKSLTDIKNTIYQNIYNNLVYIYKTKGTEKSFRNMIRAFGIDDELVRLNMYGNGVQYEIRENRREVSVADRFVNFNTEKGQRASVYQLQDPNDTTNTTGFIDSNTYLTGGFATTLEADVLFPLKLTEDSKFYFNTNTISASLFGIHGTDESQDTLTWPTPDRVNFQVYAVRDEISSDNVRFELTGTAGGYVPHLQSQLFQDVYQNTHWNLSVRVRPEQYPRTGQVFGADSGIYVVELHGVQVDSGIVLNEFTVSGSASGVPSAGFVTGSKRVFIGAHRQDFDGTVLQTSDVRVNACRYWLDYVDDDSLRGHAYDTQNYGSSRPTLYPYPFQPTAPFGEVLTSDTLMFNWEFAQNTGSNASGQFTVADEYAHSSNPTSRQGWIGDILNKQYTARGTFFDASSIKAVDKDFMVASKLQLPENIQSSDMIQVLNAQDQQIFTRDSRPVNYFFAFEKSMAAAISVEMINYFATLKDINNIIGAPVNRYRPEYKGLKVLRQRFFERVSNNEVDFEKFYEFYKWFDSSLTSLLQQLAPASADFADNVRTIIESHMLERSKYQSKLQNVKKQDQAIQGVATGVELTGEQNSSPEGDPQGTGFYSANAYSRRQIGSSQPINFNSWQFMHAPLPVETGGPPNLTQNSIWWQSRAERSVQTISSSEGAVNLDKQVLLASAVTKNLRSQQAPYKFGGSGQWTLGGVGFNQNKKVDYVYTATTPFGASRDGAPENVIAGFGADVEQLINTTDVYHPAYKQRLGFIVDPDVNKASSATAKVDGNLILPFSIYSSSLSQSTGANAAVIANYAPDIEITNLHHDLVYNSDIPVQGPFTEKFVGGRQARHTELNSGEDNASNRAESFKIDVSSQELSVVPPNYNAASFVDRPGLGRIYGLEADVPTAHRLRNVGTKRPVNIQNIKMTTASAGVKLAGTVAQGSIGNYQKNYQVVMSNARRQNDPFFNDQSFDFALHPETLATRGRFPLSTESTANPGGNLDYELPNRTGTGSNQSIIVNRFAGSGYEVMSRGFMGPAHEEMSVYNASPYHNLAILDYGLSGSASVDPSISSTIRVQDQLLKVRGLDQRSTLHCGQYGIDSAYGHIHRVYTPPGQPADPSAPVLGPGGDGASTRVDGGLGYSETPSWHKVNRNTRNIVEKTESYGASFGPTGIGFVDIGAPSFWQSYLGPDDYLNSAARPYTFSVWVKIRTAAAANYRILLNFGSNTRALYYTTSSFASQVGSGTGRQYGITPYQEDTWYHVVTTYGGGDTGELALYVNGDDDGGAPGSQSPDFAGSPGNIGGQDASIGGWTYNSSYTADAIIRDAAIYDRALSPREVKALYNHGKVAPLGDTSLFKEQTLTKGLIAWYKFDPASGDTATAVLNSALAIRQPGTRGLPATGSEGVISSTYFQGAHPYVSTEGPTTVRQGNVYDNQFVQHQIPQSDGQYSWIRSGMYSGSTIYGLQAPSAYSASHFPQLITASDMGVIKMFDHGLDSSTQKTEYPWYYNGVSANQLPLQWSGSQGVFLSSTSFPNTMSMTAWRPTDFVGLNVITVDAITASTHTLGADIETTRLFNPAWTSLNDSATSDIYRETFRYTTTPQYANIGQGLTNPDLAEKMATGDHHYAGGLLGNASMFTGSYQGGYPSAGRADPYAYIKAWFGSDDLAQARIFNSLMLNRNGPFGYPTWKQVRTGDHKVARTLRKKNVISHLRPPPVIPTIANGKIIGYERGLKPGPFVDYTESPVMSIAKPIRFVFEDNTSAPDPANNVELLVSYQNNLDYFSNIGLNNVLDLAKVVDEGNAYNTVADYAVNSDLSFMVEYSQTIYPKETNTYQQKIRTRETYTTDAIWNDCPTFRWSGKLTSANYINPKGLYNLGGNIIVSGATLNGCLGDYIKRAESNILYGCAFLGGRAKFSMNSQGIPITGSSTWPLDFEYSASAATSTDSVTYGWFPWRNWGSGSTANWSPWTLDACIPPAFPTRFHLADGKDHAAPGGELMNTYSRMVFPGKALPYAFGFSDGAYYNPYKMYSPSKIAGFTNNTGVFAGCFTFNRASRWIVSALLGDDASARGAASSLKVANSYTMPLFGGNMDPPTYLVFDYSDHTDPYVENGERSQPGYWSGWSLTSVGQVPWTAGFGAIQDRDTSLQFPAPQPDHLVPYWGGTRGVAPYKDYKKTTENLRSVAKDYTIIPEFKINDHLEGFIESGGNFLDVPTELFSLTGSGVPPGENEAFFKTYSSSDFMKYFKVIDDDFSGKANASGTRIERESLELSCEAMLQFIPYEGFYPAERTVYLGSLLSRSLGDIHLSPSAVANSGSVAISRMGDGGILRRVIQEPLMAPGILYNTIKSGIAVSNFVIGNLFSTGRPTPGESDDPTPRPDGQDLRPLTEYVEVSNYPLYENLLRASGSRSQYGSRGGPNFVMNIQADGTNNGDDPPQSDASVWGASRAVKWFENGPIDYDFGGFRPDSQAESVTSSTYSAPLGIPTQTNRTTGSYGFPLLNLSTFESAKSYRTEAKGTTDTEYPANEGVKDMNYELLTGGYFLEHLPFEAIRDPDKFLGKTKIFNEWIYDTGAGMSALHAGETSLGGSVLSLSSSRGDVRTKIKYSGVARSPLYRMGIDNFLCETYNFFLNGPKNTSFVSKQEREFLAVKSGSYYGMQVELALPHRWGWDTIIETLGSSSVNMNAPVSSSMGGGQVLHHAPLECIPEHLRTARQSPWPET